MNSETSQLPRSHSLGHALPEHLAARRSAQQREFGIQFIAVTIAFCSLVGASLLMGPVNAIRKERQFMVDPASVKGLPPDIALLGKLGTFRALAIDWASIRAERLKEEGKMYEAMRLHETVCALAPRFPKVWANAAWNMAYNISVTQYSAAARWKWVQDGIKIIRGKGIVYNPRSVTLYKELSWIFWHKIGDFMDDEHWNYKRALAVEMETLLGPAPTGGGDQEYFNWFKRVVDAPRDWKAFVATDGEAAGLIAQLGRVDLSPDISLLEFVARNMRSELRVADLRAEKGPVDVRTEARKALLEDAKWEKARDRLLAVIRSRILREQYHMDVDWMYDLMVKQYGPLDWRNAYAHALYWSSLGDKLGEGVAATDPADAMNTARFVFFSLQQLVTRGRISLYPDFDDPFRSHIETTPDTRYIPYLFETYMRLGKKHFGSEPDFKEGTPGPRYMNGFVTAMQNWIELLYLEGGEDNRAQAENYFAWLRKYSKHPDGRTQERYLISLDEFVMGSILSQLQTFKAANAIIGSFIRASLKYFSLGQSRQGVSSMARAVQCYKYWSVDIAKDFNERRQFPHPWISLRDHVKAFMEDERIDALSKARLWSGLPLEQRQLAYDRLQPLFVKLCETQSPPWDVQRAFTEPVGMEEFRKKDLKVILPDAQQDAEQGDRF